MPSPWWQATIAIGALSAVGATTLAFQRHLIFQRHLVTPQAIKIAGVEAMTVDTTDGERLKGYWKAPSPGKPVVVTFHGNAADPEVHMSRFAGPPWSLEGWGALAIAYRGYPGSTGSPSEAGLLLDGEAALSLARRLAPGAPILLHGHSLGSAVAVAMAARHPPAALYLEAPFTRLGDVARGIIPLLPDALLSDQFRSDEAMAGIKAPTLIVHGSSDTVVSARLGRRLAAIGGANVTFSEIPGDHISIFGALDRIARDDLVTTPQP